MTRPMISCPATTSVTLAVAPMRGMVKLMAEITITQHTGNSGIPRQLFPLAEVTATLKNTNTPAITAPLRCTIKTLPRLLPSRWLIWLEMGD